MERLKLQTKLRAVDLFCGVGGFSTGFVQAGIDVVIAVDYNEIALKAHEVNHPNTEHLLLDLYDTYQVDFLIDKIKKSNIDIIIGSPPCQQFSSANMKKDVGKGLELVEVMLRIIEEVKPKYWLGENVKPSRTPIEEAFQVVGRVYNSADYGVPQKRERYFFGNFIHPPVTHQEDGLEQLTLDSFFGLEEKQIQSWKTVKDIIDENEEGWKSFDELPDTAKKRVLDPEYQKGNFAHHKLVFEDQPAQTLTAHHDNRYLLITNGRKREYIEFNEKNYLLVSGENSSGNGRYVQSLEQPSWTLTTSSNYFITNNIKFRKINIVELKRIMGFPDDYIVQGNMDSKLRQIGNAVCPPLAKAFAEQIIKHHKQNS
tara:strand:- start:629 stop:1738 length:1110 start_codon:yes stop_codon:yes gene_type:complete